MDRKRVVTASLIVLFVGLIITTVGSMIASGVDQGGTTYQALSTASVCFIMLFFIVIAVFEQDFSKDEQNQSQTESDSSLL
ncbi:MAG: hypothetical protein RTV72_02690 [Candidatus Thorarchaeota archaeon]